MRILIVTPYLPHRRVGHGGGTAVRQMILALARRHEVAVLALRRPAERSIDDLGLGDDVRVETVAFTDATARGPARLELAARRTVSTLRAWLSGRPPYALKYDHPPLLRRARELVDEFAPDVVQVEYLQLTAVAASLRRHRGPGTRPRLVLDSHEHGALPRRRRAAAASGVTRWRLEAAARSWDRLARDAGRAADVLLAVTDQDRALLAAAGAAGVVTVPLGIDTRAIVPQRPEARPKQVLFVGSFAHPPNRDAARRLCADIWPEVHARRPDWRLVLAGPGSDGFLAAQDAPPAGVTATGFVDDLAALFRASAVFAAPLEAGGGIKIKILEAMARGIPLVTTPIGAEGIVREEDDLVGWAARPEDFAPALLRAIDDPEEAERRAQRARAHVEAHFGWDAVVDRLEAIYRESPSGA
ncbi:glycosyltransferase [bacterium]|nr:glycosyltransferase [bacterium]